MRKGSIKYSHSCLFRFSNSRPVIMNQQSRDSIIAFFDLKPFEATEELVELAHIFIQYYSLHNDHCTVFTTHKQLRERINSIIPDRDERCKSALVKAYKNTKKIKRTQMQFIVVVGSKIFTNKLYSKIIYPYTIVEDMPLILIDSTINNGINIKYIQRDSKNNLNKYILHNNIKTLQELKKHKTTKKNCINSNVSLSL